MSSSDRRATVFPGNANVSLPSKRPAEAESESSLRLSLSNIPKVPKFLQDQPRKRPAQLPVKVNPTSQRFSPTKSPNVAPRSRLSQPDKSSHVAQGTLYHRRNPWKEYYAILREEQAGNVTLAHKQELEHPIVVVKQQRCTNSTSVKGVAPCSHENVVSLLEIFYDEDVVFFIYECMDVSLAEIQSTRYGNLASYQIAAVCREVWHLPSISNLESTFTDKCDPRSWTESCLYTPS